MLYVCFGFSGMLAQNLDSVFICFSGLELNIFQEIVIDQEMDSLGEIRHSHTNLGQQKLYKTSIVHERQHNQGERRAV